MIHILRHHVYRRRLEPMPASTAVRSPRRVLIAPLARAHSLPSLAASFGRAAGHLGFSHYVISRLSRAPFISHSEAALEMICAHYPAPWVQHYQKNRYALIDPVHRTAFTQTAPYRWGDITDLNRPEQRVLDEALDAGLANGISVPIHEPMGRIFLVNLSGPASVLNGEHGRRLAYLIGTQFHFEFERLAKQQFTTPRRLTPRQCECLTWVARGKSSWETGKLLGISPHTVDYHVDTAMKILNVNSRTSAAVQAMALGLINP
jgi:LuxR family quorum-sensing system transcriptional regulator CciR